MSHRSYSLQGANNTTLYVEEYGKRENPAILFLHGLAQCRLNWQKQVDSNLVNDFRLIRLDLRGHGFSEQPKTGYQDSKIWADDLHAVIEQLQLSKPVLCAWSYSGLVVSDYLQHYGEENIAGIHFVAACTEIGTTFATEVAGPLFLELLPELTSLQTRVAETARQKLVQLLTHPAASTSQLNTWLSHIEKVPALICRQLLARTCVHRELLQTLTRPVLLTHGEHDAVMLLGSTEQQKTLMPHAELSVYPGIGHSPFWENPLRFNEELSAFAKFCTIDA